MEKGWIEYLAMAPKPVSSMETTTTGQCDYITDALNIRYFLLFHRYYVSAKQVEALNAY